HRLLPVIVSGLPFALALALSGSGGGTRHLLIVLLVAPLLEEAVFRAGLQEALLRRWQVRPCLANVVTACVFAVAHMISRGDASAFSVALPALLIGEVYRRTGRLRWCMALHAAMNAVWLGWQATGPVLLRGR
ncbi:MAG TPA: JDVT-CTERM system glutamic-type intramembrane protease, partial [Variovorax sp.]|nr:JDVT-CTERM system glutamic-type intramembrane protease [Variovorax sp.]